MPGIAVYTLVLVGSALARCRCSSSIMFGMCRAVRLQRLVENALLRLEPRT